MLVQHASDVDGAPRRSCDTRGIIKMTADADSNEVLGVAMVGLNAGEVIHEAAMAMRYRAKIHNFIRPAARVPDDGRGTEDRRNLPLQKPSQALMLR